MVTTINMFGEESARPMMKALHSYCEAWRWIPGECVSYRDTGTFQHDNVPKHDPSVATAEKSEGSGVS